MKSIAIALAIVAFGTYYAFAGTGVKVGVRAVESAYSCVSTQQHLARVEGPNGDPVAAAALKAQQDRECGAAERGVKFAEAILPKQ